MKILIATHNHGKLNEFQDYFQELSNREITLVSADQLKIPEPDETGLSFEDNALLKANHATAYCDYGILADDSGYCLNDLDGAPGIYSARWAGKDKDFRLAMERINSELAQKKSSDFASKMVCVLAYIPPLIDGKRPKAKLFRGEVHGDFIYPPKGDKGFGYDSCFRPYDNDMTFGEMEYQQKKIISHRTKAFEQLIKTCF